ncbi:Carbohydrate binding domain-containing protein [Paenibacillus sp. UNCCL117]|uniref:DUF4838 domain-containing protein n=1 Tax=unclassified Paenibacillus TaxID=185978 RepID=UPI00087DFEC5|nr:MULTISPECIES: DUF4838 domain-containing protein [unclassified Paenibacillus]SDC96649.1 Carbohydrate binding domain-containing protein [Paenibacillus sp. cl123]SFW30352.1 Carbohydrate binding domain-containing protein [Paenibacillus sp. UNCCL117]
MNLTPRRFHLTLAVFILLFAFSVPVQNPAYGASPDTNANNGLDGKGSMPLIVKSGLPNADIIVSPAADDMEMFAATELQETVKLVSGADLPLIRGEIQNGGISVELRHSTLNAAGSGDYPFEVDLLNNRGAPAQITFKQTGESLISVSSVPAVALGKKEAKSVTMSVYVPPAAPSGSYEVSIQTQINGKAAETLMLKVVLDRNLLHNPGFELATLEGWYAAPGISAQDGQMVHSGSSSLRMGVGNVRTNQSLTLQPGKQYVLQAWVKGSTAGKLTIDIREMANPYVTKRTVSKTFDVTDQWTLVEMPYTQENNLYDYNWIVFHNLSGTGPGSLWIDDVYLAEKSGAPGTANVTGAVYADMGTAGSGGPEASSERSQHGGKQDRFRIILGTDKSLPALKDMYPEDFTDLEGTDGFAVRKAGKHIYIIGSVPKGVLNGVYDFLEENTGVLWTRSTDYGTLYDHLPTIAARQVNYRKKPALPVRGWLTLGVSATGNYAADAGTERMLARNKNNAKFAFISNQPLWDRFRGQGLEPVTLGHNLNYWLPNDLYFKDHPEYYNEINGEYVPVGSSTQINFYHPDVPHIIAERAKQLIGNTGLEYVGIGINDNSTFEQGELSRSPFTTEDGTIVQPDDPTYRSTVFFSFLNKVAREVRTAYPDAKVVSYAYAFTDTPPKVPLEDNIVIVYAPLYEDARQPLKTDNTSNPNYGYNQKLKGWVEKTKNIIIYNYYGSFPSEAYERPIAAKVKADMQYYRDLGILGVLPEGKIDSGDPGWGVNALQFWLFNKLFWDPDADIGKLKAQFISKAYGAAAEPMTRYYNLLEQGWNYDQAQQSFVTSGETLVLQYIVKAGIKDAAQQALNEAYALADERVKKRIAPIKNTFERMTYIVGDGENLSATAVKTTASKEEILASLDFSTGPWTATQPVTDFRDMTTKELPRVQTKAYLLWDDENLYVGYENFDSDISKIIASDTAPNEWWASGKDDSVETYLTGDQTGSGPYYAFMTNPLALNLDYRGPSIDPSYEPQWASSASVKFDRWNTVQAIPFSSIGVDPQALTELRGMLFRNFHRTGYGLGLYGWGGGAVWSPSDFKPIYLSE